MKKNKTKENLDLDDQIQEQIVKSNSENISEEIPSKSLIFLKALVIGMGIVFVVLLFALILIKQKKSNLRFGQENNSTSNFSSNGNASQDVPHFVENPNFYVKKTYGGNNQTNCTDFLQLKVEGEIEQMQLQNDVIIILTKPNLKTKKQEIIRIDSNCSKVINRIEINQ